MKIRFSRIKGLIQAILTLASTHSLVAETMVLNEDDGNGKILQIISPDDLHLDPASVIVAIDVFGNEDSEVNGVLFQTDKTDTDTIGKVERDGVTVDLESTHFIDGWAVPPTFTGGDGASADNLSAIMEDIRWSQAPNPLTMDVSGLASGGLYELQLLVNEGADRDRHWDISVNDVLTVDDFTSEGTNEDPDVWSDENTFVYVGEFEANNDGQLNIIMQQHIGGQDQLGGDNNPILQALIVHEVNTSDDDPNVLAGSAAKLGQVASTPATVTQVRIRNSGPTKELVISGVEISGADMAHFTVLNEFPITIPPDTRVDGDPEPTAFIDLSFDPLGRVGAFMATMEITSTDQTEAVNTIELSASVINRLGPASHLPLDEPAGSLEVGDISGNGADAIVEGGATLGEPGLVAGGTALRLSVGAQLKSDGRNFEATESFAMAVWAQLDTLAGESQTVFANGDAPSYALLAVADGLWWLNTDGGDGPEFGAEGVLSEGPQHIVMVYDNTAGARKASIYVNGVAVVELEDQLEVSPTGTSPLQIGAFNGVLPFNGVLDDVQYYRRPLTADEVKSLFDNPGLPLPLGVVVNDSDGDGLVDSREAELGTDPLKIDTDGDGLEDGAEVTTHLTNPLLVDTDADGFDDPTEIANGGDPLDPSDGDIDRDGLTNGEEEALGTDPTLRDTDGDRFGDAFEVANNFDPLDANSPGDQAGVVPIHYENDFDSYANDETDLRDGSILTSSNETGKIVDMTLQLTEDGVGSSAVNFKLPVIADLADGFVFEADLLLEAAGGPADGFSFNYGEIDDGASAGEEGHGSGLAVEFDTYDNGGEGAATGIGIDVSLDGEDVEIMRLEEGEDVKESRFFTFDGEFHPVRITWTPGEGGKSTVTVLVDGIAIYEELEVDGFEPTPEARIAFGARTGGATETVQFDNMKVSGLGGGGATNLLINGSFEEPILDNINTNNLGTAPTGWSQTGDDATWNLIRNDGSAYGSGVDNAADGSQIIDLNGEFEIFQNFTLAADSNVIFGASFANREGHDGSPPSTVGIYDAAGATLLSPVVSVDTSAEPTPSDVWLSGEASVSLPAGEYQLRVDLHNFNNVDAVFAITTDEPPLSVVSQWSFEGNLSDSSAGTAEDNLTPTGDPEYAPGVVGQAVKITAGGLQRLRAEDSDDLDLAESWTLEAYVWPDADNSGEWDRFWTKWGDGGNQWHTAFRSTGAVDVDNGLDLFINDGDNIINSNTTAEVPLETWSHVAFVGDSASGKITAWLNGEQVGETDYQEVTPGDGAMNFGNFASPADGLQYSGLIDEAKIHAAAVDQAYLIQRTAVIPDGPPVVTPTTREPVIVIISGPNAIGLSFTGAAGKTYDIQFSTDLQTWQNVETGQQGVINYEDTDATRAGGSDGYYRAIEQ